MSVERLAETMTGIWASGKVVQFSESNWKGKVSRWRKEALKKEDQERKRRAKRRKKERPLGGDARGRGSKGVAICGMMKASKQNHQSRRKDAVRYYTTQHVPGAHLNFTTHCLSGLSLHCGRFPLSDLSTHRAISHQGRHPG